MKNIIAVVSIVCAAAALAQVRVRVPVPAKTVDLVANGALVAFLPDGGCSSRAEVQQAGATCYEADRSRTLQHERPLPGGLCRGLREFVVSKVASDFGAPK